jgi:hypothetical protein
MPAAKKIVEGRMLEREGKRIIQNFEPALVRVGGTDSFFPRCDCGPGSAIQSKAEVRAVVGYSSFPDESPHHFVSGGSVRLYLAPGFRVSQHVSFKTRLGPPPGPKSGL